jgi:transcriptional regulator with XRE-family HTH domain
MGFKERLREEIEYRGLLVKEVSAAVGISNSTFLSYIDARGVLPNVETAVKIARYLGVSVEYLVDGEKPSKRADSKTKSPALNPEKLRLTQAYEKLSAHDKNVLLKIAATMAE